MVRDIEGVSGLRYKVAERGRAGMGWSEEPGGGGEGRSGRSRQSLWKAGMEPGGRSGKERVGLIQRPGGRHGRPVQGGKNKYPAS